MTPTNQASKTAATGGITYVLTNPIMQGYVYIGKTQSGLKQAVRELSSANVPVPYEIHYACTVGNMDKVEKVLNRIFKEQRVGNSKFFATAPESVVEVLEIAEIEDVTPGKAPSAPPAQTIVEEEPAPAPAPQKTVAKKVASKKGAVKKVAAKKKKGAPKKVAVSKSVQPSGFPKPAAGRERASFVFSMVDVRPGTVLTYVHNKNITATVVDERRIKFEGKLTYLSSAAKTLIKRTTGKTHRAINGPSFWVYRGKNLNAMRMERERAARGIPQKPQGKKGAAKKSSGRKKEATRRLHFKFSMVGIKKGAVISYFRNKNVKATVLDDRHIELRGKKYTVTGAARKLSPGENIINGTWCWLYNGEVLAKMRLRMGK